MKNVIGNKFLDKYTAVYHLSHIDLDGYGCQFLTKTAGLTIPWFKIVFHNTNYGEEMAEKVRNILNTIENKRHSEKKILFLITDLNLSRELCMLLDEHISIMENVDLLLVDHHTMGDSIDIASEYRWYNLDGSRSGTKFLYDILIDSGYFINDKYRYLVDAINAADIFKQDDYLTFRAGRIISNIISEVNDIPSIMFNTIHLDMLFKVLSTVASRIEGGFTDNYSITGLIDLEEEMVTIRKELIWELSVDFTSGPKTKSELTTNALYSLITKEIRKVGVGNRFIIELDGVKGILTAGLDSTKTSDLSHILLPFEDIKFVVNVTNKGGVALRAKEIDVSKIARVFGGGGHMLASGCKCDALKKCFTFESLRDTFIEEYHKLLESERDQ